MPASRKSSSTTPSESQRPAAAAPEPAAAKSRKPKLVRDSFTMPKTEYGAIDALKLRAQALGAVPKKSELLRAGLLLLAGLSDAALKRALSAVPALKTGRPRTEASPLAADPPAPAVAPAPRKRSRSPAKKAPA